MSISEKIYLLRTKNNLTQEDLAEDVDLTPAYIGQIERGERKVTLEKLVAIVNRLGVTIDYVLSGSLTSNYDFYDGYIESMIRGRSLEEKKLAANILKLIFEFRK